MLESVISIIANYLLPYLILSVLAMVVVEITAGICQHRARVLRRFIRAMLRDSNGSGLSQEFYEHHLIKSLSGGSGLPSYIPSQLFAVVLTEIMASRPSVGSLGHEPDDVARRELSANLATVARLSANGNMRGALQQWFNDVMDGASGAYRLRTLSVLFAVATIMVVGVNFDAVRISNYVARRKMIETTASARLEAAAKTDTTFHAVRTQEVLASLDSVAVFPLGWRGAREKRIADTLLGMLISIFAVVLTAPFLFDFLNQFMIVRSTVKPVDSMPESEFRSSNAPAVAAAPGPFE
jgi:hypothetical protein